MLRRITLYRLWFCSHVSIELQPFWSSRSCLPKWSICFPRTSSRPWTQHLDVASREMLPLRWSEPYGKVQDCCVFRCTFFAQFILRDCLAASGTIADSNNRNKTCYKCSQEGHVSLSCDFAPQICNLDIFRLPGTAPKIRSLSLDRVDWVPAVGEPPNSWRVL